MALLPRHGAVVAGLLFPQGAPLFVV